MDYFYFSVLPDKCSQLLDQGTACDDMPEAPMWYYDSDKMSCEPFMFKGCDGNENKFGSRKECMESCEFVCILGFMALQTI